MIQVANTLEYVAYLLVLDFQLDRVGNMLVLATTALPEISAPGLNSIWGRDRYPQQTCAAESLFYLDHLDLHRFSEMDERNEHHEILDTSNTFTSEGDVANCHGQLIACIAAHGEMLESCARGRKPILPACRIPSPREVRSRCAVGKKTTPGKPWRCQTGSVSSSSRELLPLRLSAKTLSDHFRRSL